MPRVLKSDAVNSTGDWQQLFEAALLEADPAALQERFQTAKDAIMDRIEDCFDSASLSERRLLLSALNTVSELERLSYPGSTVRTIGHAA